VYDALLLDNDGVLVTPVDRARLREAAAEAFAAVGVDDPDPADVERIVTDVSPAAVAEICESYDLDPSRFFRARDRTASAVQCEAARAGETTLYDDVDVLDDVEVPMGVVSTNQQATLSFLYEFHGLADRFEAVYGREPTVGSLRRKKPATHYLDRALADLGVDPGAALFVGDSESDVRAARNAGVDSAFVRRPHRADSDLAVEPTHELSGLADLRDAGLGAD